MHGVESLFRTCRRRPLLLRVSELASCVGISAMSARRYEYTKKLSERVSSVYFWSFAFFGNLPPIEVG